MDLGLGADSRSRQDGLFFKINLKSRLLEGYFVPDLEEEIGLL
jgi:hypothetical protein